MDDTRQPGYTGPIRLKSPLFSPLWSRLDAYIFSEITAPFLMGMLVYNGIFFIKVFSEATAEFSSSNFDIPASLFLLFMAAEIPAFLNVTLPLSFLLASLTAIGRLSSDSEILAPQSLGISFWRLTRGVLVYGALISLLGLILSNWVGPRLKAFQAAKQAEYLENLGPPKIRPGVINAIGNTIFYVDRIENDQLADLLIVNDDKEAEQITVARRARIHADRGFGLYDTLNIELPRDPDKAIGTLSGEYIKRPAPAPKAMSVINVRNAPDQVFDSPGLYQYMLTRERPERRRQMMIELCERVFLPLTCLVLALFAVPMAAKHSRMRRGSGLGLSLVLMALFFIVSKVCKNMVLQDKLEPVVGIAAAPALFLVIGIVLQFGKNLWFSQYIYRIREYFAALRARRIRKRKARKRLRKIRHLGRTDPGLTVPPSAESGRAAHTLQFPRRLDVYVTKYFFSTHFLVHASVIMLFILIEYTSLSRAAAKNEIATRELVRYILYKLPEILDISMFICLLISTLIVFAVMSKNHEITAIRAGGGSLQRLCVPLMVVGLLASGLSFYMENYLLPITNRQAISLRLKIKNRQETLLTKDGWVKTNPGELLNYRFFDSNGNRLVGVRLFRIGSGEGGELEKIDTESLIYDDGWKLEKPGRAWHFSLTPGEGSALREVRDIEAGQPLDLAIATDDLSQHRRKASEFSISELREYLAYLRVLGFSEKEYQTELYAKFAQPLLPFLMMLLAMPLGFQFGRRGTFYGIGMGLILGLLFWGMFEMVKQMGASDIVHPIVAAWSVVTLFGFAAIFRFIQLD